MTSQKLLESNLQSHETDSNKGNSTVPATRIPYKIAHIIPGRIRFLIPRLADDSEYSNKLKGVIENDARVTSVRINPGAASIVVKYKADSITLEQMREHLVDLIQNAPNITLPKKATARTILVGIFDAVVNFIDSLRNVNKVTKGITNEQLRKDSRERVLTSAKGITKRLKSVLMFVLPKQKQS